MRARTLYQPWASLMAVGLKYIETRGQRTTVRGRVAIHAGLTCDWRSPVLADLVRAMGSTVGGVSALHTSAVPLGAVVATGNLVDCIPITASATDGTPTISRHDGPDYPRPVLWQDDGRACWPITDQLLFGDFTPGRWAWIFEDVEALPEPIPARGHRGWWEWEDPRA